MDYFSPSGFGMRLFRGLGNDSGASVIVEWVELDFAARFWGAADGFFGNIWGRVLLL